MNILAAYREFERRANHSVLFHTDGSLSLVLNLNVYIYIYIYISSVGPIM